jgi:hypothetical protein
MPSAELSRRVEKVCGLLPQPHGFEGFVSVCVSRAVKLAPGDPSP